MSKRSEKAIEKPKLGAGSLEAAMRQGLAELRGALYPESNVVQPTPYGMYGTKTPGEVADDRDPERRDRGARHDRSVDDRLRDARTTEHTPDRDDRSMEMD